MSTNLYWRPDVAPKGHHLSCAFKFIVRENFEKGEIFLAAGHLDYLRGMAAAGDTEVKKDCLALIEAIDKYGSVILWEE